MTSPEQRARSTGHIAKKTEQRTKREEFIRCDGIWKVYNEGKLHEVRALADVSLTIGKGSLTVFRGPSGSGKTTLISIIGTIDRPSRGWISFDGKRITDFSDVALSRLRRKRIGFVFQNFSLIPRLAAWENVSTPLIPLGIRERERRHMAMQMLGTLGLADRANHAPEELSGGEQQKIAIARAMINDPDTVILDEPTSNIDAETVSLLVDFLENLKSAGKTIIVSSHEKDLFKNADVVFKLKKGRIAGVETP